MDIVVVFCQIDDFCRQFEPLWRQHQLEKLPHPIDGRRRRPAGLALSETLTLLVWFHLSGYRTFKHFYQGHACQQLRAEFPGLPGYTRMVGLIPSALAPLCAFLNTRLATTRGMGLPPSPWPPLCFFLTPRPAPTRGTAFIASFPLKGPHNRRIHSHKVFAGLAQRGRSSVDWFFGFKLHFIINDTGELVAVHLTPGQVDDRTPVPGLAAGLWGKLFGDRGYVSQKLFDELWADGVQLVPRLKRRMKNRLVPLLDDLLLRKRGLIDCVGDQLKNLCQIEHTRHRSPANAFVNIIAALVAYCLRPSKPSLGLTEQDCQTLVSATI